VHFLFVYTFTCTRVNIAERGIQGGEDSKDAFSRRSFSAKEPLIVGLFGGK